MSQALLEVKNLKVYYPVKVRKNVLTSEKRFVKAVDDISFSINQGETFGLVGESGCGKSTTGKTIVRLLRPTAGQVLFEGQDIFAKDSKSDLSQKIQIIFQDPYSSLDPRFTVGRCIAEPMRVHKIGTAQEQEERVRSLMHDVGLRPEAYTKYPHEFSGGQRQRIGVARALALNPSLIVCDEPVSALDVSIQAQILNLMQDLQEKYKLTYLFISHNLAVVEHLCDRVAVMYLGNLVEVAETEDLFCHPGHPYTQALLDAIPIPDPDRPTMRNMLEGDVPSLMNPPTGCCFHTRCPHACEQCSKEKPCLRDMGNGHFVACHLAGKL